MPAQNLLAVHPLLELGPWRLVHWYLAALVLAAVVWVRFGGQHRRLWADHDLAWWLWHWFTGGRLEAGRSIPTGEDRGTVIVRRAAVGAARTLVPVAAVAGEYVRSGAYRGTGAGTVAAAGAVGTVGLAAVTLAVAHAACRAAHHFQWVRPLHRAVWKPVGWDSEDKKPRRYLTVPRNRLEGGDGVVVKVAPHFDYSDQHKKTVTNIVAGKLDLGTPVDTDDEARGDVTVTWVPHGRHGYVQFRPRDPMPERAMFAEADVRQMVEAAAPSKPIIGITRGRKPVAVDLDTESPHVLLSAGTGGGKSSTIRTIAAQLMWHGADVIVIDVKRHSHRWARGLPGVTYARDIGEIHRVLCELGRLGHERNRAWDDVDLDEHGPMFTRKVIICEELNATTSVLRQWWKDHREPGDPQTSPAVAALGQILFMGRAVRIHVLAIAQMATAKDMGGPEMRENYAVRILARYTANAAKMLVPECNLPASTRHPGRAQVCIGGRATETQVIFMAERDARTWVMAGDRPQAIDVARRETPVSLGKQGATVADTPALATLRDALAPAAQPALVTLVEASSDRGRALVDLSYNALRKAAERDPEFPAKCGQRGPAYLYAEDELPRWARNRPRGTALAAPPTEGRNEVDEVDRMEAGTRA